MMSPGCKTAAEFVEHRVDRRPRGHVDHDEARRREQRGELLGVGCGFQAFAASNRSETAWVSIPATLVTVVKGIEGKVGAHFSEADDAEAADDG